MCGMGPFPPSAAAAATETLFSNPSHTDLFRQDVFALRRVLFLIERMQNIVGEQGILSRQVRARVGARVGAGLVTHERILSSQVGSTFSCTMTSPLQPNDY